MKGYYYLGSPHSHPDPKVRFARYEAARDYTVLAASKGTILYSPIMAWHHAAIEVELPKQFEFYQRIDETMILNSKGMIILEIEGWKDSRGLNSEIEFCQRQNIRIHMSSEVVF